MFLTHSGDGASVNTWPPALSIRMAGTAEHTGSAATEGDARRHHVNRRVTVEQIGSVTTKLPSQMASEVKKILHEATDA